MRPLVIGNWKMHGSRQSVAELLGVLCDKTPEFKGVEAAVCPAFVYLPMVAEQLKGSAIAWGAQDVSAHESGAHTGDIAASMLKDWSCTYVLLGHSERRVEHAETNEIVAEKFRHAVEAGLTPVLCIGETLAQREKGQTLAIVKEQLAAVLDMNKGLVLKEMVVAYEPVWAIGTGKTASVTQAQEVHAFIREQLKARNIKGRIVYGGSVNAGNARELFAQQDIDGGLIGGASLQAESFVAICKAAL